VAVARAARHRVVIVGGGFGGVAAAKALARAPVEVTLVDRTNHHLFQPLLYQVATGILSEGEVAPALRSMFRHQANVRVLMAEVTGLDLGARAVEARVPDGDRLTIGYDSLIVAAGSTDAWFGHREWASTAHGMKTLDDARRLRSAILGAFEMAEASEDPGEREAWTTFVIVGGGPTGVELSGQVAMLAWETLRRDFRAIDTTASRVVLVEHGPAVLGSFPEKLRARAERDLRRMGVELRLATAATGIDAGGVDVEGPDGQVRIPSRTVIWAAGVRASPLARMVGEATGAEVDRAGRVAVAPDCSLPGRPEVFAIGDMIALDGLPGVAQPAIQEGKYVAGVIEAQLAGWSAPPPFRYFDKGSMATIGRKRAVVDAFGVRLAGRPAKLMWAFVHISYLVGWGNRFGTTLRWLWTLGARNRRERLISVPGAGLDGEAG
jgi:NADH:ubiquinone reductase (H+-translocating)